MGNGSDLSHNLNATFAPKKAAAFPKVEIHLVVNTEKIKSPEEAEDQNTHEENGIHAYGHCRRVGGEV